MIALDITRRYVIMIIQTMRDTYKFYVILGCFIFSYFLFLLLTQDDGYLNVFKVTYTLTLGELDFEELNFTRFMIFVVYTTLITLVLMNLLIAILSDAYELVQSEKRYYDSKSKLNRSLMYERIIVFFMKLYSEEKEQEYHYLFASMPLNYEEDVDNEDEGMIGKILNDSRKNQKEITEKFEENQQGIKDAKAGIKNAEAGIKDAKTEIIKDA